MRIDEYDFENTAWAVFEMNPSAKTQYDNWQELKEFMISMAYKYSHKNASFSTGGFVLTAYDDPNGERVVRASVHSYTAMMYIKAQEKLMHHAAWEEH